MGCGSTNPIIIGVAFSADQPQAVTTPQRSAVPAAGSCRMGDCSRQRNGRKRSGQRLMHSCCESGDLIERRQSASAALHYLHVGVAYLLG